MEPAKPDKINLINRDRQEGNSFAANYAKQPGRGEAVRTETPAVCCPASLRFIHLLPRIIRITPTQITM
jgi:hypothetical protein